MDHVVTQPSLDLAAYRGRRVMVTGHTGFKGAWLSFWLQRLGAVVTGYALPPTHDQDLFNVLGLAGGLRHIEGDVRCRSDLAQAVRAAQPEVVFHLAAQALVGPSYRDAPATFDTNIMGTVNLLECLRACDSLRSVVVVTSDKCYRNREWEWGYRESDELGGHDPYSASKAAAEVVAASYRESFFSTPESAGLATARAGNVIGGGDWSEDRLIPDCIRALQAGRPIELRRPEACRPWQHVLEPLRGYMTLGLNLAQSPRQFAEAWNFGPLPGDASSVGEVVQAVTRLWGSPEAAVAQTTPAYHETRMLRLCADKAMGRLGWRPRWRASQAIQATVEWYRAYTAGEDMVATTAAQIDAYEQAL